jgi:hypothetical protein
MDRKAVAAINDITTLRPLSAPIRATSDRAMRLCTPLASTALANIKAPMNKRIILSPKAPAAVCVSITPKVGSSTKGSKEVTGNGMHSVTHHQATQTTVLKVSAAGKGMLVSCVVSNTIIAIIGPSATCFIKRLSHPFHILLCKIIEK